MADGKRSGQQGSRLHLSSRRACQTPGRIDSVLWGHPCGGYWFHRHRRAEQEWRPWSAGEEERAKMSAKDVIQDASNPVLQRAVVGVKTILEQSRCVCMSMSERASPPLPFSLP